jgi:hypothetical protein
MHRVLQRAAAYSFDPEKTKSVLDAAGWVPAPMASGPRTA